MSGLESGPLDWKMKYTACSISLVVEQLGEGDAANYQAVTEQQNGQHLPPDGDPERSSVESRQSQENREPGESASSKRRFTIPPIVRLVGFPKTLVVLGAAVSNAILFSSFETVRSSCQDVTMA